MGYEIERKKLVLDCGPKRDMGLDREYFAVAEMGSNNMIPHDWTWHFLGFGYNWRVIGDACKWAADAESGMIQPHKRRVPAENYIKQWRAAILNAIPLERFLGHSNITFELAIEEDKLKWDDLNEYHIELVKGLVAKYPITDKNKYDKNLKIITIAVKTKENISDFVMLLGMLKDYKKICYYNIELEGAVDVFSVTKLRDYSKEIYGGDSNGNVQLD